MVLLKIVALTDKGREAITAVSKTKTMKMAKFTMVNPSELNIAYAQHTDRIIRNDSSLMAFAISRGVQMAQEAMAIHGALPVLDFKAEVIINGSK